MNKKIKIILMALLIVVFAVILFAIGYNKYMNTYYSPGVEAFGGKKVLITYYDKKGETELIANAIHSALGGGDMVKLEPFISYPSDDNEYMERVKEEKHNVNTVTLKERPIAKKYDVIFVGTPVELYAMAPTVKAFLLQNDFSGKIVIPFIVYFDDKGAGAVPANIRKLLPLSSVKNAYITKFDNTENLEQKVKSWIGNIRVTNNELK